MIGPVSLCVVAGATGDIGRSVVARLVGDGHHVLAELAALHPAVRTSTVDVGADAAVEQIATALDGAPVRMVVHMAAAPLGGAILETPASTVMQAVDVKVNGLLRLVRAVLANLVDGGRVVAVGGNLAFDPVDGLSTAGIANAAQANAVRQLSQAWGPVASAATPSPPGRWRPSGGGT